jgi:hypothetical protein
VTIPDLFFLASVLFVFVLLVRIAVSVLRRERDTARRLEWLLGLFIACYVVGLTASSYTRPRRFYAARERRCFDDWCVATAGVRVADSSMARACPPVQGSRTWIAVAEVASVAKRIRQRARDARAELEDQQGNRYEPCALPLALGAESERYLHDELGPGESFRVSLPFQLPDDAEPAGLVVHHGDFPGVLIIGADQSYLHRQALMRLSVEALENPRSNAPE